MKLQILTLISLLFIGCGGGSSSNNNPSTDNSSDSSIKRYNVSVTPSSSSPSVCHSANGNMIINGSSVSGTVKRFGSNTIYVISGTYITDTGAIEGGFAISGQSVAEYSGTINGSNGNGSWSDDYGCNGSWTVTQST